MSFTTIITKHSLDKSKKKQAINLYQLVSTMAWINWHHLERNTQETFLKPNGDVRSYSNYLPDNVPWQSSMNMAINNA